MSTIAILEILSIIGSLCTIILGVLAIWLSLYFYREGNKVNKLTTDMLSRIESSSHAAETNSREIIKPTLDTVLNLVKGSATSNMDTMTPSIYNRISSIFDNFTNAGIPEPAFKQLREKVLQGVKNVVKEVPDIILEGVPEQLFSANESRPTIVCRKKIHLFSDIPPVWISFIGRINNLEKANKFLGVKWLREKKFVEEPEYIPLLQEALEKEYLIRYHVENPQNPNFKTMACRLDRDNPFVSQCLALSEKN
jgi:hypothetical protein